MIVSFSTFSKKLNSTARSSGGTSYNCTLKKGSSKLNPYIELAASNPTAYNYAYIPTYGRYYYVENWTFDGGLWSADLSVDVLASFKEAIGAASLYILRSSAEYDEKILDTLYPAKQGYTTKTALISHYWADTYASGSYVVGVVSNSAASGAVAYYVLSYSDMAALRSFMMSDTLMPAWDADWDTLYPQLTGEMIKAMINPFQYIASCQWLPFQMYSGGGSSMTFGYWDSGLSFPTLSSGAYYDTVQVSVPQDFVGTPEEWRRLPPFARYELSFPPFGTFELDGTYCAYDQQLGIVMTVDPITGDGHFKIEGASTSHVYADVHAQVGVPVQLAQLSTDVMGAVNTTVGTLGGIASKALSGDIAGAITSAVSGVGNIAQSTLPILSTTGGNGGVGALRGQKRFTVNFRDIVDTDNTRLGRPLCKTRTPAGLGGYMVAQSGACIASGATQQEKEQIRSFVEGGFYYE